VKEDEIRKNDTLEQYLTLVERDMGLYFDRGAFVTVSCPACGSGGSRFQFTKSGFHYVSCSTCATLYASLRPTPVMLEQFYSSSESSRYWVTDFFMPVAEVRREKIFRPRALRVHEVIKGRNNLFIGDIGAGFGIFLEELRALLPGNRYLAIEPSPEMASIIREKDIDVTCSFLENLDDKGNRFDLLVCFELLEHLFDPFQFMKGAAHLLKPGGLFFGTTLNSMGFDILTLWEHSKSVSPPHHINFFNPSSLKCFAERAGFEAREISTPGLLDWDIVEGMITRNRIDVGRFWNVVIQHNESAKQEFQDWLRKNNLSSHMQFLLMKNKD